MPEVCAFIRTEVYRENPKISDIRKMQTELELQTV